MSTQVFPVLIGKEWPVSRSPIWSNQKQNSVSGARTAIAFWTYPKWQWKISHAFLGSGTINGVSNTDYQSLVGFFNARYGGWDTFLYEDAVDNAVTAQALGVGDGVTASFQLVRSFGAFVEPIFAPHTVTAVKVNGVAVDAAHWSVSSWGSATPGVLTFAAGYEPGAGLAVTADFSYYFPVEFDDDTMSFENFMSNMWSQDGVSFTSIKLGS